MNTVQSVMKAHVKDKWSWFYIPWMVVGSSFIINWTIGFFINDQPMYTGGLASIYIYMLVAGIITVFQTFPFMMGMNVRRTDYFKGTFYLGAAISLLFSLILLVLAFVEGFTNQWGVDMHYFKLPYLHDGNPGTWMWINFSLIMHMFSIGMLPALIFYRYGRAGLFSVIIGLFLVLSLLVLLATYLGWWMDLFEFFKDMSAVEIASLTWPFTIVYVWLGYGLIRKSAVK